MKKNKINIVSVLLALIIIVSITIQIGTVIGCYMLSNMNMNKFNIENNIRIVNK